MRHPRRCVAFTVDGVHVSAHVDGNPTPAMVDALRDIAATIIANERENSEPANPVVIGAPRAEPGTG